MLECDYQINSIIDCISIYSDLDSDLKLSSSDVKRLNDYIETQKRKIEELCKLVKSQAKEIVNLTGDINNLEL